MKWYCHLLCAILLLALISTAVPLTIGFLMLFLIGAIAPDVIERSLNMRHRGRCFHEVGTGVVLASLGFAVMPICLEAFGLGCIHHVLLDCTTRRGAYIFGKHVKGNLKANRVFDNVLAIILHALLLALFTLAS